jgi:hypothetical protein
MEACGLAQCVLNGSAGLYYESKYCQISVKGDISKYRYCSSV